MGIRCMGIRTHDLGRRLIWMLLESQVQQRDRINSTVRLVGLVLLTVQAMVVVPTFCAIVEHGHLDACTR
jgi:hypothetical protein